MLVIRLQPIGKKHQQSYRIAVAERRSKLIGPPVEDLGSYNPFTKEANVNAERLKYWIGQGAQSSVTLHNLFVKQGIIEGPKILVPIKKKAKEETPAIPAEGGAREERPATEASVETPEKITEEKPATEEKPSEEATS